MAGFLETTKTVTVKDTYSSSYYQQASVTVTVSTAGKVSWKISMSNDREGSKGRGVYLSVKIAGTQVGPNKYIVYSDSGSTKWLTYPTGNGTSDSGSFTLSNTNVESIKIEVYVCCMQNSTSAGASKSETLTRSKWTDVGKGTVTITDNGNNTFTLKGTKGANGTNNTASGPTLSWGYTSSYGTTFRTGDTVTLTMTNTANASRTVYARSVTSATLGSNATATASLAIKQYVAPGKPGTPVISYSKNRLTIKENWKYSWSAATATNSSSPIKGYRIYLYKNNTNVPIVNSSGTTISSVSSQNAHYYELTGTSITIDPIQNGFKAGDTVKLAVKAFSANGKGSSSGLFSDAASSVNSTVQNAGVVHVRNGGTWAEGQVKVRVNGQWVEAQSVKVYNNGQWVEAK
jgi:hypothetical protein